MAHSTCLVALGGGDTALSCVHVDDAWAWARRQDAAPGLTLINAFLAVQLALIDAGAHRAFALTLTAAHVVAGTLLFAVLVELSVVASELVGVPGLALRAYWGDSEPLLFTPLLVLGGALLGVLHAWATRAPPLLELHAPASWWRNARHALQCVLVTATSFYVSQEGGGGGGYEAPLVRAARPEWVAYAATRTLALLIVYVWNRADDKNRALVYGADVRAYDAVWARLALVYAVLLAACAWQWARAPAVVAVQLGAGAAAVAVCAWTARNTPQRSAWGSLKDGS